MNVGSFFGTAGFILVTGSITHFNMWDFHLGSGVGSTATIEM